jgi:alpha-amylase/alpha-mannosidase (GH57 family)
LNRYVCIHGHFYQPPRENPWLEAIEVQDSAHPFHDWNHRITAECYGPNAAARILDDDGWIVNIVNNFSYISFNVGPTLLSWMEIHEPRIYHAILEADRDSSRRFGGHGSALAQVYNHMIMPLANERDKRTQVAWGIRDFEQRFGRKPEGMWLAEAAADRASLAALLDQGIEFTILAPGQCTRIRDLAGNGGWHDVGAGVDTTRPYWVDVGDGRRIAVFFYHGPIARGVAFEGLLNRGEAFAERLMTAFAHTDQPQLAHIATDGETYGHHHAHGEMGLAYALHYIERNGLAELTNYGQYLELHPPTWEAEIVEPSSWSCFHGVERWRADCGCRADPGRGWNQAWRRPLRESLDWLRDRLVDIYATHCPLDDPWAARERYIDVVLNRSDASVRVFLEDHGATELAEGVVNQLLGLLEMQRHAMLMFTSCGWFFDELTGIETVQCIQYAGRAIQLALPYDGDIERQFLDRLRAAKSNIASESGDKIYEKAVKPAVVDLAKVVAHYAVMSMFEDLGERASVYGFDITRRDYATYSSGRRKLVVGRVDCRSLITRESATLSFAALTLGDHNLSGGVRAFRGDDEYEAMRAEVTECFRGGNLANLMRLLDRYFLEMTYSLNTLFRDEQRKILSEVLDDALEDAMAMSRRVHQTHASLIRYVVGLDVPLPETVRSAADFILNANLEDALSADVPDPREVRELLAEARGLKVELEVADLTTALQATIEGVSDRFAADPLDAEALSDLEQTAELVATMPFEVQLFRVQNQVFRVAKRTRPELLVNAADGDEAAVAWLRKFAQLTELLRVRVA